MSLLFIQGNTMDHLPKIINTKLHILNLGIDSKRCLGSTVQVRNKILLYQNQGNSTICTIGIVLQSVVKDNYVVFFSLLSSYTAPFMVRVTMILLRYLGIGGGNPLSFHYVVLQVHYTTLQGGSIFKNLKEQAWLRKSGVFHSWFSIFQYSR